MIEEFKKEKHLKPIDKIKKNPKYLKYQLDRHESKAFPISLITSSLIFTFKLNHTKYTYTNQPSRYLLSFYYFLASFSLTYELIKRNYSDTAKVSSLEDSLLSKEPYTI